MIQLPKTTDSWLSKSSSMLLVSAFSNPYSLEADFIEDGWQWLF